MKQPFSIGFVLLDYFPYGGQQRDFLKIVTAALSEQHQVTALVNTWSGAIPNGLEVVKLPAEGRSNHRRLKNFSEQVLTWRHSHQIDVLVGFIRMPELDIYFAADPCYRVRAMNRHGFWVRMLPRFRVLSSMEAAVFSPTASTHILTLTHAEASAYQACYQTPAQRFTLLPPGVTDAFQSPSEIEREVLRKEYGLAPNSHLLLMVGSHFRTKGVDRSLRALASLPKAQRQQCLLWIAGAGKSSVMEVLARSLGIADQVRFLGGRDDVAQLMQAADLLLQPSRTELAGMTIVEALSSDLPVIVSGECGYAPHVKSANAGMCLSVPFQQSEFDTSLMHALTAEPLRYWRTAAKNYSAQGNLRGMATQALAHICNIALAKKRKGIQ